MNAEKHQVEKIKEFEHQQKLNENALYAWAERTLERIRSGKLVSVRTVGLVLAAVIAVVLITILVRSGTAEKSRDWADFAAATNSQKLKDLADQHPKSPAARPARLQAARILLGPEGIDRLASKDKDQRTKAIANVEQAREEMAKLADEFKGDVTLRSLCLMAAGEAELALVGIPVGEAADKYRGTVEKAAEYFQQVATTAGAHTPAGEAAAKKAADLLANKDTIKNLGQHLFLMLTPVTNRTPNVPNSLGNPVAPPDKPVVPDLGPLPTPAAAVAGGAAGTDPTKKEDAPNPRPKKD